MDGATVNDDPSISVSKDLADFIPEPGFVACWSLGGMGFALKGVDTIVFLDPFLNPDYRDQWVTRAISPPLASRDLRRVDLVLASHEHPDHCDPIAIGAVARQTEAVLGAPVDACEVARSIGFPEERIRQIEPGDVIRIGNAVVRAYPSGDRVAKSALIYLIKLDGIGFVHAGDSLLTDAFDTIGRSSSVDVALLATALNPSGEHWYMQPQDLVEAAHRLRATLLVPGHWDIWQELARSPDELDSELRAEDPLLPRAILPAGTRLVVGRTAPEASLGWSAAKPRSSQSRSAGVRASRF
jgi:L-ascorbate 6-phosphate lactonase